jgi:hypothetical protein
VSSTYSGMPGRKQHHVRQIATACVERRIAPVVLFRTRQLQWLAGCAFSITRTCMHTFPAHLLDELASRTRSIWRVQVLSIVPRAAALYDQKMSRGLDGDPEASTDARLILKDLIQTESGCRQRLTALCGPDLIYIPLRCCPSQGSVVGVTRFVVYRGCRWMPG